MTINIEELIGSSAGVENKNIVFVEMAIGSSHQITTETEAVEFGFDENMIVESTRSGDDLVLELANGEVVRLLDYYGVEAVLAFAPAAGGTRDDTRRRRY